MPVVQGDVLHLHRARRLPGLVVVLAIGTFACQPTTSSPSPVASEAPRPTATAARTAAPATAPTATTPSPSALPQVAVSVREITGPLGTRMGPSGVWTGSEVLIWGGHHSAVIVNATSVYRKSGGAYDPASDRWRRIASAPIDGRYRHLAAWTGEEMLVWGGYVESGNRGARDGAAYDPSRDRWRTIAPSLLGNARRPASVMHEGEWIIAVTTRSRVQVNAYDPDADSWRLLPSVPGPISHENRLVSAGSDLILVNVAGGMYRLARGAEAWVHSASQPIGWEVVWTGTELLGAPGSWVGDQLVRYDAAADAWVEIPGPALKDHRLIWTGALAILAAGPFFGGPSFAFDPATNAWWELDWPDAERLIDNVSVWTDQGLVEWGGWSGGDGALPTDRGWVLTPDL